MKKILSIVTVLILLLTGCSQSVSEQVDSYYKEMEDSGLIIDVEVSGGEISYLIKMNSQEDFYVYMSSVDEEPFGVYSDGVICLDGTCSETTLYNIIGESANVLSANGNIGDIVEETDSSVSYENGYTYYFDNNGSLCVEYNNSYDTYKGVFTIIDDFDVEFSE